MKIQNISSNQQTTRGYVSKSFIDYVNTASKNECLSILKQANIYGQKVNVKELIDIKSLAKGIISKFSKYMDYLEQHTCLSLSNGILKLNNPVSSKGLEVVKPYLQETKAYVTSHYIMSPAMLASSVFWNEKAGKHELNLLDKVADNIGTIDHKEIDKSFLKFAESELKEYAEENGTNIFKRYKARKVAERIDNYAQRIGEEPVNKVRVEEYIRKSKELDAEIKAAVLKEKQIKKDNVKVVNDILNS